MPEFNRHTFWLRNAPASRHRSNATLFLVVGVAFAIGVVTGCGTPMRVFVHADADMSYYTTVGVLPFKSLGTDRFAGEKFSVEFTTALLSTRKFEVLDQGIFVNAVAKAIGATSAPNGLDRDQLKRIADATGVQGVFMGTVTQYEMVPTPNGNYPVISVEAHLLDAGTGTIVWKATATERGGPKTPVIGIGEIHTLGELAQKISKKLANRID